MGEHAELADRGLTTFDGRPAEHFEVVARLDIR
jgi:hypothetical protein